MRRAAWKLRSKAASHCSSVMSRKLVRACSPPALLTKGVDPAVPFEHGGDHAVGRGGVGEVGLDGGSLGAGFGVDRIAVDADDDGSLLAEQTGGGLPDA